MNQWKKTVFVLLFCFLGHVFAIDESSPVLAIEPILDRIGWYMSHKAYSLQMRLSAELLSRYECTLVSRNVGLILHQERGLASLKKQLDIMPKPHWIIGGSYQAGQEIANSWRESDIELVIVDAITGKIQREVFREKAGHYNEAGFLADQIAQRLKLKPKTIKEASAGDRIHEVWAVLPLQELVHLKDYEQRVSHQYSDLLTYKLQENAKIGKLVDRSQLENILLEHQIHSFNRIDTGAAAQLGRLLSADKIICGTLSAGPKKGEKRLDLLLISSKDSVISSAVTSCFAPDELEKTFHDASQKLIAAENIKITFPNEKTSQDVVDIELERLLDAIKSAKHTHRQNPIFTDQIISLSESYLLLNPNSGRSHYMLCEALTDSLFYNRYPSHWQQLKRRKTVKEPLCPLTTLEQCKYLNRMLLPLLDQIPPNGYYRDRLNRIRFELLINGDAIDEAEAVLNRSSAIASTEFSAYDRGKIAMMRNKPKLAGDIFAQGNYRELAMYAYSLAGEQQLAYETAKQQKPLFTPCMLETMMIYLELLEKFESPEATLEWIDHYEKYSKENMHKKEMFYSLSHSQVISQKLKSLRSKTGSSIPLSSVSPLLIPFKPYPIYLQGVGNAPEKAIAKAAALLRKNLDLNVVVLPTMPMPTDGVYHEGSHRFRSDRLLRAVRFALNEQYPQSGVLFMCITMEPIYHDYSGQINSWSSSFSLPQPGSMALISMAQYEVTYSENIIAAATARAIFRNSMRSYDNCSRSGCIGGAFSTFTDPGQLFWACPECLAKLKSANPQRGSVHFSTKNWLHFYSEEEKSKFQSYREKYNKPESVKDLR